ncbi:hypothetical protein LTR36_003531 [Oleoguttula mirabilis]|uniref:F-box domain-containing protein n=1 Tax=Oleoguttula mirabilis TaxID=1507867 RepID=A0AAV9JIZ2_9PEZI|nr:hypothetical protein LTR36_003531 [Oleoguttula mirabilis]
MSPCDPYSEPDKDWPTTHERLITYLDSKEARPTAKAAGDSPRPRDLPTEVLESIFSYVPSKHDVLQVCQASRRFFAIATPILYHDMQYTISSGIDPILISMFTIESIGLRYVRNLTLSPAPNMNNNQQNLFQLVRLLINHVPVNMLESFRWDTPHSLPPDVVKLLWQRHRYLRNAEVFKKEAPASGWSFEDVELLQEINRLPFPELKSIRIVPDAPEVLFTACAALQKGRVTDLELDGRYWEVSRPPSAASSDAGGDDQDDDEEEEPDLEDPLTGSLFSHLERVKPCRVPRHDTFTRLTLSDIDLTNCKRTWFTYVDLCHLKELRLEHCVGADIFLVTLSAGATTPRLHALTLVHDLSTAQGDRTIYGLEDLLTSPKHTLRTLKLSLRNARELPSVTCIRSHGKTLKRLLLDISGRNEVQNGGWDNPGASKYELVYDGMQFESILQSCSSLVELGMAFPEVGLEYNNFGGDCGEFSRMVMEVVRIRVSTLKTLNIINWPKDYQTSGHAGYYAAKVPQLARLACDIFALHRCFDPRTGQFAKELHDCRLDVIAFGVREHSSFAPDPVYFAPSEISALSKVRSGASDVSLDHLRARGLRLAILDYPERDFHAGSRKNDGVASRPWASPRIDPAGLDGGGGGGGWAGGGNDGWGDN